MITSQRLNELLEAHSRLAKRDKPALLHMLRSHFPRTDLTNLEVDNLRYILMGKQFSSWEVLLLRAQIEDNPLLIDMAEQVRNHKPTAAIDHEIARRAMKRQRRQGSASRDRSGQKKLSGNGDKTRISAMHGVSMKDRKAFRRTMRQFGESYRLSGGIYFFDEHNLQVELNGSTVVVRELAEQELVI